MKLFLLRHADAINGFPDSDRCLSPKGIAQTEVLARTLNNKTTKHIKSIWHSPLLRAKQTATLFAKNLNLKSTTLIREDLIPGGPIEPLAHELETLEQDTLLVGHNPHMEALTSFLLKRSSHPSIITFKKAGIVCLEYSSDPDQSWILQWYAFPSLLA